MKKLMVLVTVAGLLAVAIAVNAQTKTAEPAKSAAPAKAATPAATTLKGELVDTGCYIGHDAKGEKHVGCATKCIAAGMPMGVLTADGKLYLITRDHEITDPYEQAKTMAGSMVEATGVVAERGGMRSIDLTGIKLAAK